MTSIQSLIQRVRKTQQGFADIKKAAEEVFSSHSAAETLSIAKELFASEAHQARMLATFLLGKLAARSKESPVFLRQRVSRDEDWRVQEILAQAFDGYCKDIGYEKAPPVIKDWLADANPNVRRAVAEGLRIWTTRPYFREHPQAAVKFLSQLKADESEYVRRSAGNALRDISRKHKDLVAAELEKWNVSDQRVQQTHELACRFLK